MNETEMRIHDGREFLKFHDLEGFCSDQRLGKPQPPLTKPAVSAERIPLEKDFSSLPLKNDFLALLNGRESRRVYTDAPLSLTELSFLLWATQGVKSIRGDNYATLRTVPCGGARHEFETYLLLSNVEGLAAGRYHYLPLEHALEPLGAVEELNSVACDALAGQGWAAKAAALFCWSVVPYRAEWRYGVHAHRIIPIDLGHIGENLYLACEALGLGTCGVGAFDREALDALFQLDGEEEFFAYTQPVGRIAKADEEKEAAFYAHLKKK